ncbi:MAG: methyltransferase regulatory domain-containing protein [Bryobacteraceae bacterium]
MNPDRYDVVRYPTEIKTSTHPDRLAAVATLFDLSPAPPERCRVLEIGCGDGGNLIPMAFSLPGSRFTGIDRAETAVAAGRALTAELGLSNLDLQAMDLMDFQGGEFDYIIAHGIYSWVPAPVRERILAICAASLAPCGLAYISYNALPGWHIRQAVRDMLQFHTGAIGDPQEVMRSAREFLTWLKQGQADTDFGRELESALEREPNVLFHDELGPENHPFYFHQFVEDAARHGLQHVADANLREMFEPGVALPEPPLLREQYLDFYRLRRFRRSILCREGLTVAPVPRPERLATLYASSDATASAPGEGGAVEFAGRGKSRATTAHPLAISVLSRLSAMYPRRVPVAELAGASDGAAVAEILLRTSLAGLVQLHACAPKFAAEAGDRPEASRVARLALAHGSKRLPTLHHELIEITDETSARAIALLDGTRSRAQIAREFDAPKAAVDELLQRLARLPLLTA